MLGGGLATPEPRAGGVGSGVAIPSKLPSTCALVTFDEVGEGLADPNYSDLLACYLSNLDWEYCLIRTKQYLSSSSLYE